MARRPTRPKARPARRRDAKIAFDAIVIEGALLQPELVTRIATSDPTQQLAADYGLDPGEKLREVVQTKFTQAQSLHARFSRSDKGPAALKRFLSSLFAEVFEFKDLSDTPPIVLDGRVFPIGHHAVAGKVPIVFAPFEAIDKGDKAFGDAGRQRAPVQMLQEYLNAAAGTALWGLAADGGTLRLCRANSAMTRPAYIEADLAVLFDADAPRLADFSALWLFVHASRFGKAGTSPTDCALERWRDEGREKGARAREDLRNGVEQTLKLLGQGFLAHPANAKLKDELAKGALSPQSYLDALLRLVYRLIFVFAAEDRDLLHLPQPQETPDYEVWRAARDVYRRGYGLARLRELSSKRQAHDRNIDGWEGTKILFRELWHGQPKLALPALGGLFAPGHVRDFADCQIANQYFYPAIFNLAWLRTDSGLERVNWRDMETEELGSVYESLLELTPDLSGPLAFDFIEAVGHERKTTASYYTPDSLVQVLLDEALDPLIAERTYGKGGEAAIHALLNLRIIDPACGSAHFLLAAARRLAVRCAQLDKPGEAPSPADFRHWLREVARRVLFGVDKNPMAIELAKVALWIETVEPGKPLSFLEAHLRCGDSLLGIYDLAALQHGIPDAAYKSLTGDVKAAAAEWHKRNKAERDARKQGELKFFEPPREVIDAARALEIITEDELAAVEAKADKFRGLLAGRDRHRMETACDLYVAAFLLPKAEGPVRTVGDGGAFVPTSRDVWDKLTGARPLELLEGPAVDAAKAVRAFHWPLEFPHVFFPVSGRRPGFDLALGNPPWDISQLGEEEYFSTKAPEIAQLSGDARKIAISRLQLGNPPMWKRYQSDKREFEAANEFFRFSGRFEKSAVGRINSYALFVELNCQISQRSGMIVPTGIATDTNTAGLFGSPVAERRLLSLLSFREIRRWFIATDDRNPFCLLTLSQNVDAAKFAFSLDKIIEASDRNRRFTISPQEMSIINPSTRTAPVFRSRADAEIVKAIYRRIPIFLDEARGSQGNPWGIEFRQGLFNMTSDSALFRTETQLVEAGLRRDGYNWVDPGGGIRYVPMTEGEYGHIFDHRYGTINGEETRITTSAEKANPSFEISMRYWVPLESFEQRLALRTHVCRSHLLGHRRVARGTDARTVIAALLPFTAASYGWILTFARTSRDAAILAALYNSFAFDYCIRNKLSQPSIPQAIFYQTAIPGLPDLEVHDIRFLVSRVLELTYTSHSMKPFAVELGHRGEPFSWDEDRRALLRAELDAKIAKLYGLTRDELRYILDPADVYGATYPSETFRVLKKNEIAAYGEFRSARLVLDAWGRIESGELTT
jgi:hypothetical protein